MPANVNFGVLVTFTDEIVLTERLDCTGCNTTFSSKGGSSGRIAASLSALSLSDTGLGPQRRFAKFIGEGLNVNRASREAGCKGREGGEGATDSSLSSVAVVSKSISAT